MLKGYVRATLVIFNNYIIKYIFLMVFLLPLSSSITVFPKMSFLTVFFFGVDFNIFMRVICARALYYLRSYNKLGCN